MTRFAALCLTYQDTLICIRIRQMALPVLPKTSACVIGQVCSYGAVPLSLGLVLVTCGLNYKTGCHVTIHCNKPVTIEYSYGNIQSTYSFLRITYATPAYDTSMLSTALTNQYMNLFNLQLERKFDKDDPQQTTSKCRGSADTR